MKNPLLVATQCKPTTYRSRACSSVDSSNGFLIRSDGFLNGHQTAPDSIRALFTASSGPAIRQLVTAACDSLVTFR